MSVGIVEVREAIRMATQPAHFFIGPGCEIEIRHQEREETSWQIFQGRLLDASQTRQCRSFESCNVLFHDPSGRSSEPLLSVKWDDEANCLHIVRSIYSYAWEGYDAGDNVFLSREVRKWLRELVGTIALPLDRKALQIDLANRLFQAVVGLSRLPLNSLEAPLPCFSLGQLAYFFQPSPAAAGPMRSPADLIDQALTADRPWTQQAKLLEFLLRSTPLEQLAGTAQIFAARWQEIGQMPDRLPALFRTIFEEVALSPYTDFVDKTLRFLRLLQEQGVLTASEHIDFLSLLLRQLGRHLTAYDLVVFHHRGANYPDALLLDAALKAYLALAEENPGLFAGDVARIRRRALRQAVLFRHRYEGHEVPDVPTSPGENARVLPEPNIRVPDEQIIDPSKRRRRLFADDPITARLSPVAQRLLEESIADLIQLTELRELGTALFLDRPLGIFKRPTEPDQTLLLSYVAFSRSIAEQRLRYLAEILHLITGDPLTALLRSLETNLVRGIPLNPRPGQARPGVVSLSDALKVAPDFVLLRTTRRAVHEFLAAYDVMSLDKSMDWTFLTTGRRVLIVGGAAVGGGRPGALLIYDEDYRLRAELEIRADDSGAVMLALV